MLTFEIKYNKLLEEEKLQLVEMWLSNKVLTFADAVDRVSQAIVVAKDNNKIVGVTTAYPVQYKGKEYFAYRMFIAPEYRNRIISRKNPMSTITREYLASISSTATGVICVIENKKISDKIMTTLGWKHLDTTEQGIKIWVWDFPKNV